MQKKIKQKNPEKQKKTIKSNSKKVTNATD